MEQSNDREGGRRAHYSFLFPEARTIQSFGFVPNTGHVLAGCPSDRAEGELVLYFTLSRSLFQAALDILQVYIAFNTEFYMVRLVLLHLP